MTDIFFKSLRGCDTIKTGSWTIFDDPSTNCIVLAHPHNMFAIRLPYDSRGEFATFTSDSEHWITPGAQEPSRLPGGSGLSPGSKAATLTAWAMLDAQDRIEAGWLGLEVSEGWVIRHYETNLFLVFSKDSNGWVGVFDSGTAAGALLMSALDPQVARNRMILGEYLVAKGCRQEIS